MIEELPGAEPGYRFFVLELRQPVDHADRTAGTFEQRLTLLHTATDRPMVLYTTGYGAVLTPRRTEPATVLRGNQLQVEHRYFGVSRPPSADYAHLTIRQAADDHHRVDPALRRAHSGLPRMRPRPVAAPSNRRRARLPWGAVCDAAGPESASTARPLVTPALV
ncbi:hypothetical protein [Streptomyces sp. NPDC004134]|uniref:hypothetical protein n=1 Tax=Streptomyces sp. NPDC004134 TaxID=3364691 RepID=UPI0036AA14FF